MIIDADDTVDSSTIDADLCFIGCGAAGLALAQEFVDDRRRVVILEGGGLREEAASQALYESVVTGHPHTGVHTGRFRVFGGSTTRWGGQALRLSSWDFEPRAWVRHSGWPIGYEEVARYYAAAERFLMLDARDYDSELFALFGLIAPAFEPGALHTHFAKWSPRPNLGSVYRGAMQRARNIRVLLHANMREIRLDQSGNRVESLEYATLRGRRGGVRARQYVLCAGGIETARLLLASNGQRPAGIGNEHDLVGRFLQDHPCSVIGELRPTQPKRIEDVFNPFHHRRRKYSVRFSLARELQEKEALGSASGSVFFEVPEEGAIASVSRALSCLRQRRFGRALWRALAHAGVRAPELIPTAVEYVLRGRTSKPYSRLVLHAFLEQEPNRESRVTLSSERDALGMPRSEVRWQLTELTARTAMAFARTVRDQFARANLGDVVLAPWVLDPGHCWLEQYRDLNHHIGTTRMSHSPREGVVNEQCRVHSVPNLYVAGSAVFPTGGHSNPTLTLIALAKRLAVHLKRAD